MSRLKINDIVMVIENDPDYYGCEEGLNQGSIGIIKDPQISRDMVGMIVSFPGQIDDDYEYTFDTCRLEKIGVL